MLIDTDEWLSNAEQASAHPSDDTVYRLRPLPEIRQLSPDEWPVLQNLRLDALEHSPRTFLSTYEREKLFGEDEWREEFKRGDWYVGSSDGGEPIALLGVTRDDEAGGDARYLEYMWVVPTHRRRGVGRYMIDDVLNRLAANQIRAVLLWVLTGNHPATRLYERAGFERTEFRQPVACRPGVVEEQMKLKIA